MSGNTTKRSASVTSDVVIPLSVYNTKERRVSKIVSKTLKFTDKNKISTLKRASEKDFEDMEELVRFEYAV